MAEGRLDIVLVRLGAVAVTINAFREIAVYIPFVSEGLPVLAHTVMFVLMFVVPVGIAAFLWTFPATVVGHVAPESSRESFNSVDPGSVMMTGIALLGLYAFTFGLLDVLHAESFRIWENRIREFYDSDPYPTPAGTVAGRITSYAQVVFGLVLMLGRKGIATLILKVRGRDIAKRAS